MRKIEQAIHHAFSKIDVSDTSKRRQVYEAIWQAHENTLRANQDMNRQARDKKRAQLTNIIKTIETSFYKARASYDSTLATVSPAAERSSHLAAGIGPEEENDNLPESAAINAGSRPRHERKHSRFGTNAVLVTLLLMTVFVIWSFYNSLNGSGQPATDNPLSALAIQQRNDNNPDGWIRVFNPADAGTLSTKGSASAQIQNEADTSFVRVLAGSADDAAIIEIGPGVLASMRGKEVTFNVIARSSGKASTQASIICDFGNGHTTGKYRFKVPSIRENLLFSVKVPAKINGPAKLYISNDNYNKNSAIDIFSVLVHTEED